MVADVSKILFAGNELAEVIKHNGIIEPIKGSVDHGVSYILVAGARRLEAARRAGLEEVEIEILDL